MKKVLLAAVFATMAAAGALAGPPVLDMTPYSIGAEYSAWLGGHKNLYEFDSSSVAAHLLRLSYSPVKFLRLSAAIGASSPYADPEIAGASSKLSAGGGVALFWPKLLPFLSIAAGYDGLYLKYGESDSTFVDRVLTTIRPDSTIEEETVSTLTTGKDGRLTGALHTPYLGLIFHACRYADIEIGGRFYYFDVEKRVTRRAFADAGDGGEPNVTGTDRRAVAETVAQPRLYAALTLHDPAVGAFLTAGGSVSPDVMSDETRTLSKLTAMSVWVKVGVVLTDRSRAFGKNKAEFSPSYIELKELERDVAEGLSREIDLEEEDGKKEK
jgi:hypothetical protein